MSSSNNALSGGRCNNAVFKFDLELPLAIADFDGFPVGCVPFTVDFTNLSSFADTNQLSYFWDFGDSGTSVKVNPQHTFTEPGVYEVMLVVEDGGSCNGSDTLRKQLVVLANARDTLPDRLICSGLSVQIGLPPINDTNVVYSWSPTTGLNLSDVANPIASPSTSTTYTLLLTNGVCTDTFIQNVLVSNDSLFITGDSAVCEGDTIDLTVNISGSTPISSYDWMPSSLIVGPLDGPSIKALATQTIEFTVQVINQTGCIYDLSDSVILFPDGLLATQIAPTVCLGDTIQIFGANTNPFDSLTLTWTPASIFIGSNQIQNPLISPDSSMWVYVEASSRFGCVFNDSIPMVVVEGGIRQLKTIFKCDPGPVQIGPDFSSPLINYNWTPSTYLDFDNIPNPMADPPSNITYQFIIGNANCADTFVQEILVDVNTVTITGDTLFCRGQNIALTAVLGNPETAMYTWSPDPVFLTGQGTESVTSVADTSVQVTIEVQGQSGCVYHDTVMIVVAPSTYLIDAGADPDLIFIGQSSQLELFSTVDQLNIVWEPAETLDDPSSETPVATPPVTTVYKVTTTDTLGCQLTDTVIVNVIPVICDEPYIYLPNAFSPNGDGKNDTLFVRGNSIESMYLAIYDRWGGKGFLRPRIRV